MNTVVVGNPGNRRVAMYAAAVRAAGLPPVRVLPWRDVLTGTCAVPTDALVRIDSPGEDPHVDSLLRGPSLPHQVEGSGRWYQAFVAGLRRIADVVDGTPGARLLNDVDDIAVMFDKRSSHKRLLAAGCPVPEVLTGVDGYSSLRQRMSEVGWNRVFVKPAHGSSASGVLALTARDDRVEVVTSAAFGPDGLSNSLRVNRYRGAEARAVVDVVCRDPVHVERWFPKASLEARTVDLRVVVVAGRATHAVVRASRHPMTNLHLGGSRIDVAKLRAVIGEARWREWMATCERAAGAFRGSLMVGVDLLPGLRWDRHVVGEVNAFGDLLPHLPGLPDGPAPGVDTYTAQVMASTGMPCTT
jgi:hypothetical protein